MSDHAPHLAMMLEVEVAELKGEGDSALARHVATCESCAEEARAILNANVALDDALGGAPPIDAAAVVARAKVTALSGSKRPARRLRPGWSGWVGLAAAAALAAVLLTRDDASIPGLPTAPPPQAHALVETATNQSVAVIETDNPDITVLWFF